MNYQQKDLVRIAKRENNTKRSYLVVDPLQGKHVPVEPSKALNLFKSLAEKLQGKYEGERLLLIGFAETATAIGAQAAITLETKYIQTTREVIPDARYLFFSEAHSHATEQKLVKDDIDRVINDIDRIVFIEDEVTTGNTIMNIIKIITKEYQKKIKFAVASLLNGMTEEYLKICAIPENHTQESADIDVQSEKNMREHIISIPGWMNARRFVDAKQYEAACKKLAKTVITETVVKQGERVLVIGTEEFMYPALLTGYEIEKMGCVVRCHSTTRSPIAVSTEEEYPLHCRYELRSLYDPDRKTFIYDLESYDRVIVMTDSALVSLKGLETLTYALRMKNENITVIRWC